jgi:hypothetical protein
MQPKTINPFERVVYIQPVVCFATVGIGQLRLYSLVSRNWFDAVHNFCDESWCNLTDEKEVNRFINHDEIHLLKYAFKRNNIDYLQAIVRCFWQRRYYLASMLIREKLSDTREINLNIKRTLTSGFIPEQSDEFEFLNAIRSQVPLEVIVALHSFGYDFLRNKSLFLDLVMRKDIGLEIGRFLASVGIRVQSGFIISLMSLGNIPIFKRIIEIGLEYEINSDFEPEPDNYLFQLTRLPVDANVFRNCLHCLLKHNYPISEKFLHALYHERNLRLTWFRRNVDRDDITKHFIASTIQTQPNERNKYLVEKLFKQGFFDQIYSS